MMKPSILLVDDEPAILFLFSNFLSDAGYEVKKAHCLKDAREAVRNHQLNAVILDLILPDGNGIDWINDLRKECPDIAIIVITGAGDIPVAVEAMRRGADNFLTKPANMSDLEISLRKSLELQRLRKKDLASQRLQKKSLFYFGNSDGIKEVKKFAFIAAEHTLPVLIQGETGTGKSMLAKYIHEHSFRSSGPFVEVSCSNLRGDLLASELFGHVRGAFTSAVQDKEGLIEVAEGGTLFLDEVGDMDLSIQAQFLKVIEEKQYRRLGEVKIRWSDFRLLCATNKNLQEDLRHGRFRQDLYYRINIFPISILPLRERFDDLDGLVRQIISAAGSYNIQISREVINFLQKYPWPGNVRELKNVLERALVLAQGGPLSVEHFRGIETYGSFPAAQKTVGNGLEILEEQHITNIIKRSGGNKIKAAEALGISKSALYRKLKKFRNPL
jgi:DNA-binding NtrC family response regulator